MDRKVSVGMHRGKLCFRYYIDRKPRFRVVQNADNIENEKIQLLIDLQSGTSYKAKREAAKQQRQVQRQVCKTLADHLQDFLNSIASSNERAALKQKIKRVFKIGKIKTLDGISVKLIQETIENLRCLPRSPKKRPEDYPLLAVGSQWHYAKAVREFSRWLEENDITKNVLKKWHLPKPTEEDQRFPRDRLQPQELQTLIQSVIKSRPSYGYNPDERCVIYLICSMTGLRRKEVGSLRPESFDLQARKVFVSSKRTKNKKAATLPLPPKMVEDLTKWLRGKRGLLFPNLEKTPTHKMLRRDLKMAKIPFVTDQGRRPFHSLRNTFISCLFDAGLPLAVIQRKARHSDIRLTQRYGKPKVGEDAYVDSLDYPGLELTTHGSV
jgi:integrase